MVFAIDGGLTYFRSQRLDGVAVNPGEFAAEPVLWTDWLHHGTLRAASFRTRRWWHSRTHRFHVAQGVWQCYQA